MMRLCSTPRPVLIRVPRYEPETKKYAVDSYPDEKFVTNIALRQDEPGVSYLPSRWFAAVWNVDHICTLFVLNRYLARRHHAAFHCGLPSTDHANGYQPQVAASSAED